MTYLTIQTDDLPAVQAAIEREFRLDELLRLVPDTGQAPDADALLISNNAIDLLPDWSGLLPPVLLPRPLPVTPDALLAVVFSRLDNWEKAYEYARHDRSLADALDLTNRLQLGVPVPVPVRPHNGTGTFEAYQRWHNRAVALHYGNPDGTGADELEQAYSAALKTAPDAEHHAFTAKHYATLLLDTGQLSEADAVLEEAIGTPDAGGSLPAWHYELLAVQSGVWLQQLTVPYDSGLLDRTKTALWQVLQHYETQEQPLQVALLLVDAAQVANFQNSFAESLGYISRAISIFREEDVTELLANAQYRKGVLLYTWAQQGSPQFYRPAMEAYQEALKVFSQQNTPAVFAEIQHHLGVIYAEIPDEVKKKSIWAAVSSSSFQQALAYFTREDFPYEYATICNHYANALTKYPLALRSDNYAKAIGYYRDALRVRTAEQYPYERALTILNYLEAGWYVGEDDLQNQRALLKDLLQKADEVQQLVADEGLIQEAETHCLRLRELVLE